MPIKIQSTGYALCITPSNVFQKHKTLIIKEKSDIVGHLNRYEFFSGLASEYGEADLQFDIKKNQEKI